MPVTSLEPPRTSVGAADGPGESPPRFSRKTLLVLGVAAAAWMLLLDTAYYSATLEDAFITFRYSEHLAEGHGIGAWNVGGERVEGYSTLAWMLVLAAANAVGFDVVTVSKVFGIGLHLLLPLTFLAYAGLPGQRASPTSLAGHHTRVATAMLLAAYLPLSWYASTGMETLLFVWLVALAFLSAATAGRHQSAILAGACALLILTRPEGVLLAGAMLGYALAAGKPPRDLYGAGATIAVTVALLLAYRLLFFGDVVPNTYWAKGSGFSVAHIRWGLRYVAGWVRTSAPLLLFVLVGAWNLVADSRRAGSLRSLAPPALLSGLLVAYTAYIVKVGGDNHAAFPFWRHFIHVSPLLFVLAAHGVTRVRPVGRWFHAALAVSLALVLDASLLFTHSARLTTDARQGLTETPLLSHAPHNPYYHWLADLASDDTVIASSLGGELPYIVDAVHLDNLGLNTRYVARHGRFDPRGPQDSKTDMRWILEQSPDVIEGYISGTMITSGEPADRIVDNARFQMNMDLASSPIFQRDYLFVVNGPYEHLDRALFVRRAWWEAHPRRDDLQCLPVSRTTLGALADAPASRTPER